MLSAQISQMGQSCDHFVLCGLDYRAIGYKRSPFPHYSCLPRWLAMRWRILGTSCETVLSKVGKVLSKRTPALSVVTEPLVSCHYFNQASSIYFPRMSP